MKPGRQPGAVAPALVRQWAELAFWFQPLSQPTGTRPLDGAQRNYLTPGSAGGSGMVESHVYLTGRPASATAPVYPELAAWMVP